MNTKSSWILLALVVLAIVFAPLIPNDVPIKCQSSEESSIDACDNVSAYVSIYTKYFSH